MAAPNPKLIGDLGLNQFENYISAVAGAGAGGSVNKVSTERLIKAAGLEGSSDPFEKMFSALTSHIENFGATDEMERKLGAIPRNFKNIEDAPYLVQEYIKNVNTGKELHLASTKSAAPKSISTSTGWKLHFDPINNNPETFDAIESHLRDISKVEFKGGSDLRNNHGEGKSYTAYPQSLEERDRVIAALHRKDTGVSHLLAPANPVEGNMQFTDNITGRFTTGYNFISPSTGEIDWSRSASSPQEGIHSVTRLRETGEVNHYIKDNWNNPSPSKPPGMKAMRTSHDEIVEDIASLKTNHPAVHELMVGKPGYNSAYPLHLPGVTNVTMADVASKEPDIANLRRLADEKIGLMDETNTSNLIDPDFARRWNEAAMGQAPVNRELKIVGRPSVSVPTGASGLADANANLVAAAKKPLIQPDKADFLPQQMVNGRSVNKVPSAMSVEELVDRRAKVYDKLLDPEYSNVHPSSTGTGAMHTMDRGTIGRIDTELAKRGEDISMLPDAPAYDPDYVPGSGKRAPYLRSIAAAEVDNLSAAVISAAPTPPAAPPAAAAVASAVASAAPVPPAAAVAAVAASAAVITSAVPAPPVAPVAAAVVSSGASGATAAGSAVAAATATSSKVINIGKKIAMNPKTKIAAAVAVAGGIIGFRCCQKN